MDMGLAGERPYWSKPIIHFLLHTNTARFFTRNGQVLDVITFLREINDCIDNAQVVSLVLPLQPGH